MQQLVAAPKRRQIQARGPPQIRGLLCSGHDTFLRQHHPERLRHPRHVQHRRDQWAGELGGAVHDRAARWPRPA
ncbi:MAG TPA: hypothetical protein VIU87_21385 [Mycobacterium sp.]